MIGFEKPELKDYLDQVVDLVLGVKRDVLAGVEESEVIASIEKLLEELPIEESLVKEGDGSET